MCIEFDSPVQLIDIYGDERVEAVAAVLSNGDLGYALCADRDNWDELELESVLSRFGISQGRAVV